MNKPLFPSSTSVPRRRRRGNRLVDAQAQPLPQGEIDAKLDAALKRAGFDFSEPPENAVEPLETSTTTQRRDPNEGRTYPIALIFRADGLPIQPWKIYDYEPYARGGWALRHWQRGNERYRAAFDAYEKKHLPHLLNEVEFARTADEIPARVIKTILHLHIPDSEPLLKVIGGDPEKLRLFEPRFTEHDGMTSFDWVKSEIERPDHRLPDSLLSQLVEWGLTNRGLWHRHQGEPSKEFKTLLKSCRRADRPALQQACIERLLQAYDQEPEHFVNHIPLAEVKDLFDNPTLGTRFRQHYQTQADQALENAQQALNDARTRQRLAQAAVRKARQQRQQLG